MTKSSPCGAGAGGRLHEARLAPSEAAGVRKHGRRAVRAHLLSLRIVLAQPKASVSGWDVWMRISRSSVAFVTYRRYCSTKRADSVFPAPDSPEMTTAWLAPSLTSERCVAAATAKICGGSWSSAMLPLYCAR